MLLDNLIGKLFDYIGTRFWDNIVFWRFSTILLLAIVALAVAFRTRIMSLISFNQKERLDQDRKVFLESDKLLSEKQLSWILDAVGNHRCTMRDCKRLNSFVRFFGQAGNQYLANELRRKSNKLASKMDGLSLFVGQHFFVYPENQPKDDDTWLAMYPDLLHGPPSGAGYTNAITKSAELPKLIDEIAKLHREYREHVKRKLLVWCI